MAGIDVYPLLVGGKGERAPWGVFSAMFMEFADENTPVICMFRADLKAMSLP